jgi:hypothetical protein
MPGLWEAQAFHNPPFADGLPADDARILFSLLFVWKCAPK